MPEFTTKMLDHNERYEEIVDNVGKTFFDGMHIDNYKNIDDLKYIIGYYRNQITELEIAAETALKED
jgi:hypothetical protein